MRYPIGLRCLSLAGVLACGSGGTASAPDAMVCDQRCADGIALRALRLAMKNVFNAKLSGQPVGPQDMTTMCVNGSGSARVFGQASSNASQGTTSVDLTYVFNQCLFPLMDSDPLSTFQITLTGTVTESGTIAVQPSSTTSLQIRASAMTFHGTVYYPPIPYDEGACDVVVGQSGNDLAGTLCGRNAGVAL